MREAMMIYLDHAATSFHKPPEVAAAVFSAFQNGTGNSGRGAHGATLDASRVVHRTREKISRLFRSGDPARVVFTTNATESLNIAVQGLLKPGDHCISTELEHNSVLRPLYLMAERGVQLSLLPADAKGNIATVAIAAAIRENTRAVVLSHASNVLGNIRDIEPIAAVCRERGILFILDAAQTAGLLPINMAQSGISAVCCSGHKSLLGPQGTGVLCLAAGVQPAPLKVGGSGVDSFSRRMPDALPAALEAGTLNTHGLAGLCAACDYLEHYGVARIFAESSRLANKFIAEVQDIAEIIVYGDMAARVRTPVVALNIASCDSAEVADELFERFGIATRAGAHCAPGVHRLYGTERQGMVRFSFSHFNTDCEVDQAISALKVMAEETR